MSDNFNPAEHHERKRLYPSELLMGSAKKDAKALFVERLKVLTEADVEQATGNVVFLLFPGHGTLTGIINAKTKKPFDQEVEEKYGKPEKYVPLIEVLSGLKFDFNASYGAHNDRNDQIIINASVTLLDSLIALLPMMIANIDFGFILAITQNLLRTVLLPYTVYHEMTHSISGKDSVERFGRRFNETLVDFWVREMTSSSPNRVSRYVKGTSGVTQLAFDREAMDFIVQELSRLTGNRDEVLTLLATGFTRQTYNFPHAFHPCTNPQGAEIIAIMNGKDSQSEKIQRLKNVIGGV